MPSLRCSLHPTLPQRLSSLAEKQLSIIGLNGRALTVLIHGNCDTGKYRPGLIGGG